MAIFTCRHRMVYVDVGIPRWIVRSLCPQEGYSGRSQFQEALGMVEQA